MATSGKPWAVILTVAVLSRLMSTDGRPLRIQQQQLLERSGYQNPEFDIDRTYELMNEKRDRIQHRPHQQLAAAASNDGDDDVVAMASHLDGGTQLQDQPAAAADGRPVVGIPPAHATATARNVTKTASIHSPDPKYHYEVHSVQHNPERYATAEQKLQAVIRQAAAVEHHQVRDADDGVRQTLLDDSEHHRQRLLASKKTHVEKKEQSPSGQRHRLEQLRHIEDEKDELGELDDGSDEDDDGYDYRSSQLLRQPEIAKGEEGEVKAPEKVAVEVRVDQNEAAAAKQSAPVVVIGDERPTAPETAEEQQKDDESAPVALPLQQNAGGRLDEGSAVNAVGSASSIADIYFLAVVIGCSGAGIAGFLFAGLCWYRLQKKMKAASEVDYPAYGVTGPAANTGGPGKGSTNVVAGSPGDKKLAQNAQMYHFHHQKQQMIASERRGSDVNQHVGGAGSDAESEEENEDGDYTVFECPGLATNGEMEVRNPMFNDPTPVSTPADASGIYQQAKK